MEETYIGRHRYDGPGEDDLCNCDPVIEIKLKTGAEPSVIHDGNCAWSQHQRERLHLSGQR